MKILVATGLFPPEIGGPATYAALLRDMLPKRGIAVDILAFSSVRHLPTVLRHIAYAWAVYRRAKGADIIFVQDTVSTGVPVWIAATLRRMPFVLRVPGDYAWEQGRQRLGVTAGIDEFQHGSYGVRVALLRTVQCRVAQAATAVIVPSAYFGRLVAGWGVSASQLHVIYNSVDSVSAIPPASPPAGKVIVTVGRLVPWKGFAELIDCVPRLPEWHLVVVGDGPGRGSLLARARERGVAEQVTFTGALSRAEVFGWYGVADAFVLNSSFESFSYQVAEALQRGVPVITTNVGSLPELVEDGVEGWLVSPNDEDALVAAIESVATEPEVWKKRVEAGKRKADMFNPETMIEKFIHVCEGAV
jgi:glycosyltransferase involved in cell wall biosynthesis